MFLPNWAGSFPLLNGVEEDSELKEEEEFYHTPSQPSIMVDNLFFIHSQVIWESVCDF